MQIRLDNIIKLSHKDYLHTMQPLACYQLEPHGPFEGQLPGYPNNRSHRIATYGYVPPAQYVSIARQQYVSKTRNYRDNHKTRQNLDRYTQRCNGPCVWNTYNTNKFYNNNDNQGIRSNQQTATEKRRYPNSIQLINKRLNPKKPLHQVNNVDYSIHTNKGSNHLQDSLIHKGHPRLNNTVERIQIPTFNPPKFRLNPHAPIFIREKQSDKYWLWMNMILGIPINQATATDGRRAHVQIAVDGTHIYNWQT